MILDNKTSHIKGEEQEWDRYGGGEKNKETRRDKNAMKLGQLENRKKNFWKIERISN